MALTKITSNAFAASAVDSDAVGANTITTIKIADNNVTHAKLHTDMDLSSKTVTLPSLSQAVTITAPSDAEGLKLLGRSSDDIGQLKFYENDGTTSLARLDARTTKFDVASYSDLHLSAGGVATDSMVIKSSGNVGIGQSSPDARLDLGTLNSSTAGSNQMFQLGAFGFRHEDTGGFNHLYLERNYGGWQTTPQMTFKANGNVGIGTDSPNGKLEIMGGNGDQLYLDNNGERFTQISLQHSNVQNGALWLDDTDSMVDLYANTGHGIRLKTGGDNPRLTVTSSGNVLVGVSTSSANMAGVEIGGNGQLYASTSSSSGHFLNRTSGNGNIVSFRKEGVTYGSVGHYGGATYINGNSHGVLFNGSAIEPTALNGSRVNGVVDLGGSSYRFNDSYFNGTVNTWSGVYAKTGTSVNFENAAGSGTASIQNEGAGTNIDLTITTGSTDRMRVNNDGTINTFSTVVGGYHYYTNGATIDTDYLANSGYVFEIAGKVNPNSGGSTYVDPFLGHIYIGHGWNGSALTAYIYYVALQPAARDIFPSGSGFSADALEVCFVSSGTEFTTIPVAGGSSYNIRVKALNYNSTYGSNFELHITRKA